MDRQIEFEGTFNFRDIGGYETAGGGTVRWRRVFRSGALDLLTEADQLRFRDEFGIATVVDLRHPDETEMYGPPRTELAGTAVTLCDASLMSVADTYAAHVVTVNELYGPEQTTEKYGYLMTTGSAEIARAFELFADESAQTFVVHCTAGKDRTGIVIALLLELLGVAREQIAAEYELSNMAVPQLAAYIEAKGRTPEMPREEWLARMATPAKRMVDLLALVERDHGSARDFLRASGVSEASLDRIVELLVE